MADSMIVSIPLLVIGKPSGQMGGDKTNACVRIVLKDFGVSSFPSRQSLKSSDMSHDSRVGKLGEKSSHRYIIYHPYGHRPFVSSHARHAGLFIVRFRVRTGQNLQSSLLF